MSEDSLNSIINALQEYNEYLGRLVSKLSTITENLNRLEGTQEWFKKIKKAEERLLAIQAEFSEFINYFSSSQKASIYPHPPSLTIQCKKWEDYKTQLTEAKLVSFLPQEKERVFQVFALEDGKVSTYSGEFPEHAKLLKCWLSKELGIAQEKIIEGVLATG